MIKLNIMINISNSLNIPSINIKRLFGIMMLLSLFTLASQVNVKAQCAVQATQACTGTILAASFSSFDAGISGATSCGLGTGDAGFIVLNVGTSGTLNLVVDGSATTGYIDVAIFNVPSGEDPCVAATVSANELSCNYAASSVGCAGFGNVSGICAGATIAGPTVSMGDRIIIIIDNYSGSAVTYDVQMYDNAGNPVNTTNGDNNGTTGADVGIPEADIGDVTLCPTSGPTQVPNSADYDGDGLPNAGGGTWTGSPFVDANGLFNPSASGIGTFSVTYTHFTVGAVCYNTDDATVTVVSVVPDAALTCPPVGDIEINAGLVALNPVDNNASGAAVTWTGTGGAFVDAGGNFDPAASGPGAFVVNYELGTGTCFSTATCNLTVVPSTSILDSDGDGTPDIADPCSCADPLNPDPLVVMGPGGGEVFHEVVTVNSGPGETWNMTAATIGALDATGAALALPAAMTETAPGIYTIDFFHEITTGYTGEFTNGTSILNEANSCTVSCLLTVPTLGEWGLVVFTLLMLNLAILFVVRRRRQTKITLS
jgi:hypothetical protein